MVGWSELFGFEMVLARISGFVLFSPILGRSNIPGYAKTGLILVLSVFVYGLGQPMPAPPGTVVELVVRLGVELVVGFVLGWFSITYFTDSFLVTKVILAIPYKASEMLHNLFHAQPYGYYSGNGMFTEFNEFFP